MLKKKKRKIEKYRKALKAETWSDTKCEESDENYANICLMGKSESDSNSKIDTDSDSDSEIEVSNLKIPIKVLKYIDKLCIDLKASLKRIFELKRKNSTLKQREILWKENFENLDRNFLTLKENANSLSKENTFLKNDISNISKRFSIGYEKLEKILLVQRPYFNKSGLGMTSETIPPIDFPKMKERIKQRPTIFFTKIIFKNFL